MLLAETLRAAGHQARYVYGSISLDGAAFKDWTGFENARAACRYLAAGGFPATVNGQAPAECNLPGAVTNVTLKHVWVDVLRDGQWVALDPSFKGHNRVAGIDYRAGPIFQPGQSTTEAISTTRAENGVSAPNSVNFDNGALDRRLQQSSTALIQAVEAQRPSGSDEDVFGGDSVREIPIPDGGWRTHFAAPGSSVDAFWEEIPDQYRTKLTFKADTGVTTAFQRTLFVDEIYGRRLELDTNFDAEHVKGPADYYDYELRLEVDDAPVATFSRPCADESGRPDNGCGLPGITGQLTVTADLPYAAESGRYLDTTLRTGFGVAPLAIAHFWGATSPELLAKWSDERKEDEALPVFVTPDRGFCDDTQPVCPQYPSPAGDFTRQKLAANWGAQFSRMAELQARVAGAAEQHHRTLGFIAMEGDVVSVDRDPGDDSKHPIDFTIADQRTTLNLSTALSLTTLSNDESRRTAALRSIAAASATLEGAVLEQTQDLADTGTTATRFAWANRPDEDGAAPAPRGFVDFTGLSYEQIGGALQMTREPGSESAEAYYRGAAQGRISSLVAGGFRVTAPRETFLGPGSPDGVITKTPNGGGGNFNQRKPSLQRGPALIATRFVAGELDASLTWRGTSRAPPAAGSRREPPCSIRADRRTC
jgi:hypothetical protein